MLLMPAPPMVSSCRNGRLSTHDRGLDVDAQRQRLWLLKAQAPAHAHACCQQRRKACVHNRSLPAPSLAATYFDRAAETDVARPVRARAGRLRKNFRMNACCWPSRTSGFPRRSPGPKTRLCSIYATTCGPSVGHFTQPSSGVILTMPRSGPYFNAFRNARGSPLPVRFTTG